LPFSAGGRFISSANDVQETIVEYQNLGYVLIHVQPASAGRPIAPLRTSDRRKLRQRVVQTYGVSPELGDLLVPDGLMAQKVATYTNDPGVSLSV
jgi:hypothetical protein